MLKKDFGIYVWFVGLPGLLVGHCIKQDVPGLDDPAGCCLFSYDQDFYIMPFLSFPDHQLGSIADHPECPDRPWPVPPDDS